jgi:GNAT superfamily N-acetyltransferase
MIVVYTYISQGLARRLLDHILDYAQKEGFKQITLSTGELIIACMYDFKMQPFLITCFQVST